MRKFSIIIPVYNVAPYLRECLDSVLAQTYTDWEAICVDDGSTDGSDVILDEYAVRDGRFRVVHQNNAGVSAARNLALDMAKGVWLLFLDSDDKWRPELLDDIDSVKKVYDNADLVMFGYDCYCDGETWPREAELNRSVSEFSFDETIPIELSIAALWQWAYRRASCGMVRFNLDLCRGEDHVFVCEALLHARRTCVELAGSYLGYRQRAGSQMHGSFTVKNWRDELIHRYEVFKLAQIHPRAMGLTVQSGWISGFMCHDFIRGIGDCSAVERGQLFPLWQRLLPDFVVGPGIPWWHRVVYGLCIVIRSFRFAYFLCCSCNEWWKSSASVLRLRKVYRRIRKHGEYAVVR